MGTARALCGNLAIAAREPYDYPKSLQLSYDFFFLPKWPSKILRCPRDQRAASVRGLFDATYDVSTGYGLVTFFNFFIVRS